LSPYNIDYKKISAYTGDEILNKTFYDQLHRLGIVITLGTIGNLDVQAENYGDCLYPEWKSIGIDRFATDRPFHVWKSFQAMKK